MERLTCPSGELAVERTYFFPDNEDVGGEFIDRPQLFEESVQAEDPLDKSVCGGRIKNPPRGTGKSGHDLVVAKNDGPESVVHEHIPCFWQGIESQMGWISEPAIEPLRIRISIWQHSHHEVTVGTNNAVQLFQ